MIVETCTLTTLARSEMAKVRRCSECGCVHLEIGPMTLRLDDAALRLVRRTLQHAEEALEQPTSNVLDWSGHTPFGGSQ